MFYNIYGFLCFCCFVWMRMIIFAGVNFIRDEFIFFDVYELLILKLYER
jgi:hypothetical protein